VPITLGVLPLAKAGAQTTVYQIDCAGPGSGSWSADEYYSGGGTANSSNAINTSNIYNPAPQSVYQSQRYGYTTYTIPNLTPAAPYTVRLHFAENVYNTVGAREFNASINGTQVLTNFDIIAAAGGPNIAVVEQFPATATNSGQIVVYMSAGAVDGPTISGIEILTNPDHTTLTPQVTVFQSSGQWVSENLSGSPTTTVPGWQGTSALGDYDGDGLVDAVVAVNGHFQVTLSSNHSSFTEWFGNPGDIPEPGDYDGDGKTDFSMFRPSTGMWYYQPTSTGGPIVGFQTQAASTDIPTPGDFDGDGKTDYAYFRPSNATFYVNYSRNPGTTIVIPFGNPGDVPVVGDYDGDGKTDFAVFRPSTGYWYFQLSTNPYIVRSQPSQGQSSDIAVPGDYDGDGKTDFAVWRPSTQTWYIILSSNLGTNMVLQLGATSPVTATPVSLRPFGPFPAVSLSSRQTPGSAYTISGNVSLNGANLTGVAVTVTGGITLQMASDLNGNYSFSIPANDSITITPSLSGYTFSPPYVSWLAAANDPVGENFTAVSSAAGPVIQSLSLTQGPAQMGFMINGSGFGTSQGTVAWGNTPLNVVSWNPNGSNQITVQVPATAPNITDNVTVTVNGQQSNGKPFTVTNPFGCGN